MKILVLSDIHGNKFGLEATLEAARNCEAVVCLGDVVGYGAHPNECCAMLRRANARCLGGNHDAAAIGQLDIQWFNPVAKLAIEWTRKQLTPENTAWLNNLEPRAEWASQGFQAVHASLRQPLKEYIHDAAVALPTMDLMTQPVCFYGHTHEADVYTCPRTAAKSEDVLRQTMPLGGALALDPNLKYLINPGSCGQPRDGNPKAKFAIFDIKSRKLEIKAVDYDYFAACAAIHDAGLPAILGDRLFSGK